MYKLNKTQKTISIFLAFYILIIIAYIIINLSIKTSTSNIGEVEDARIVSNEDAQNGEMTTKDTVIILNMKFESNKDIIKKEIKAGEKYKNLSKDEVQAKFQNLGFKIDSFSKDKVDLSKTSFYLPNKYVIGIKDLKISIYKSDEYGNLKIENQADIFNDMDVSKLPDKERDFLYKGNVHYQFDTKAEAISALDDYREFYKAN